MKRRFFLALLALALAWTPILAADVSLSPLFVIQKNGQLNAFDGMTRYTLTKDGSFLACPMADVGWVIQGKWKLVDKKELLDLDKDLTVQVEGLWRPNQNGMYRNDDFRIMKFVIHPGILKDSRHPETDIYECKFSIEDVRHKTTVPPQNAPSLK